MTRSPLRILGVMTGTSCDAIDGACVEFREESPARTLWTFSQPFPERLRTRVLHFQLPDTRHSLQELLELERDLSQHWALALEATIRKRTKAARPDLIAVHGQTVAHHPSLTKGGVTLQLGDPAWIAGHTALSVAHQFRRGDLAGGGQGAPLLPAYHLELAKREFGPKRAGVAFHNLGGVSNLTYIGPRDRLIAFDTGPANLWLDACAQELSKGRSTYDDQGNWAREGKPDLRALTLLLRHPYFKKSLPKSTGRDDFPFELLKKAVKKPGKHRLRTALEVTACSIALAYRDHIQRKGLPLHAIVFCGGGARNAFLLERIQEEMPEVSIFTSDEIGLAPQWIEAEAFAWFGWQTLQGRTLGGSWTGAGPGAVGASLLPGKNWRSLMSQLGS